MPSRYNILRETLQTLVTAVEAHQAKPTKANTKTLAETLSNAKAIAFAKPGRRWPERPTSPPPCA